MGDKAIKISLSLFSIALIVTLILKLQYVPGGMILSALFLGIMYIIGILLGGIPVASILKLLFKKSSYLTLYLISTIIGFLYFHYTLYSPVLKIIVPQNYSGEVNLVLSNVEDNVLTLDTNGIGYINQWTFNHNYNAPQVVSTNGTNLSSLCVGFSPSTFWGGGTLCCIDGKEIKSLSFEIVPKDKTGQKQYYSKDLTLLVDKKLVKFTERGKYTPMNTDSVKL